MKPARILSIVSLTLMALGLAAAQQKPAQKATARPPEKQAAGDAAKGRAVYKDSCEICHFPEAEAMKMAPGLKGIYKKGKFEDGKKVDDASMRAWIEKGGPKMPPFKDTLSAQQVTDLIAYIRTL